jgi:hypothetical protein
MNASDCCMTSQTRYRVMSLVDAEAYVVSYNSAPGCMEIFIHGLVVREIK